MNIKQMLRNKDVVKLVHYAYDIHKEDLKNNSDLNFPMVENCNKKYYPIKKINDNKFICGRRMFYSHTKSKYFTDLCAIEGIWEDNTFKVHKGILLKADCDLTFHIIGNVANGIKVLEDSNRMSSEEKLELFLFAMEAVGFAKNDVISLLSCEKTPEELYEKAAPEHLRNIRWINYGRRFYTYNGNVFIDGNFNGVSLSEFPFPFEGDVIIDCKKVKIDFASFENLNRNITLINQKSNTYLDDLKEYSKYGKDRFFKPPQILANADDLSMTKRAFEKKAKGIGLIRTEYMFKDLTTLTEMIELILNQKDESDVLTNFKMLQEQQAKAILSISGGTKNVFRLLDFKLDEFLRITFVSHYPDDQDISHLRGAKILNLFPNILRAQLNGIFSAFDRTNNDIELLVPMIVDVEEFKNIKNIINEVSSEYNLSNIKIGAMIETVSAAKQADQLAKEADFICFGTSDLTESVTGLAREDGEECFQILTDEVKDEIRYALYRIRSVKEEMPIGFCGEHPDYIENLDFYCEVGADYISCTPKYIHFLNWRLKQIDEAAKKEKYKDFAQVLKKVIVKNK